MIKMLKRSLPIAFLLLFISTSVNLFADPKANRKTATESSGAVSSVSLVSVPKCSSTA